MMGDHHCGGKCVPFEGAARVPLVMKPPAAPRETAHPLRGLRGDCPRLPGRHHANRSGQGRNHDAG